MDNMEALFNGEEPPERYHDANAFETAEEAVERCKEIVKKSLASIYKPGMTGEELYRNYTIGGDDPFIKPRPPSGKFSAWEYAKALCAKWDATSVPIVPRNPCEFAHEHHLDMKTPLLTIAQRLECTHCNERKAHCWPEPYGIEMKS